MRWSPICIINMASPQGTEPFPSLPQSTGATPPSARPASPSKTGCSNSDTAALGRGPSSGSRHTRRSRGSTLRQSFLTSNPPYGMWQAAGEVASKVPTLGEIKNGSFCVDGWTEEGQMVGRGETPHQIQRRKTSRANSLSASKRRRSTASPLSTAVDEREEFFPATDSPVSDEVNGVPSTVPETCGTKLRSPIV